MQRVDLGTSTRLLAITAVVISLSYVTGCLQPTATVKGNVAVLLKADMSGNTKSQNESCLNSADIASLHVTVDDVQLERLTDTGSELISVLDAPVAQPEAWTVRRANVDGVDRRELDVAQLDAQ